jgi:predicted TIM-barrel fold metal-dependent hydrolase
VLVPADKAKVLAVHATRFVVRSEVEIRDFASGGYAPCFKAAADHGVPIFLFLDTGDTAPAVQYLEAFPTATIILDHIGMGRSVEKVRTPDKFEAVLKLAGHRNLFIKWCHAYFGFGPLAYPFEGTHRPLRRCVDAFGAERMTRASDFTIREHEVAWVDRLLSVRESPVLSQEEKGWILGRTARRVLGWPG